MNRFLQYLFFFAFWNFFYINIAIAKEVSIGIEPSLLRIKSEIPSSIQAQITISNASDTEINLVPSFKAFISSSDNLGTPKYIDSKALPFYDTLLSRISILESDAKVESVNILGHRAKRLTIFIPIQPDTKAQDYYFSVIFTNEGSLGTATSTKVNTAVATHILLSVGDSDSQKVRIEKFASPSFFTGGPVSFTVLIDNKGSQNISVKGTLKISDMFGKSTPISILPQNILSESKRLVVGSSDQSKYNESIKSANVIWNEPFLLGLYTAELNLTSDSTPIQARKIRFLAVPGYVILTLTLIIIFVISFYLRVRKKLSYKGS